MEEFPLQAAFKARTDPNQKIVLTYEILRSSEDLLVTCLNNYEDQKRGFSFFKLCDKLREECCIKEGDLFINRYAHVLLYNEEELGEGIIGCQKLEMHGKKPIKLALGDARYSIGDIRLKTIASTRKYKDIFAQLNIKSITDENNLNLRMYGVTHPTCQIACGPSLLGAHIEHHNYSSLNIHHDGYTKEWYIIPPSKYLQAIEEMKLAQQHLDSSKFTGVCDFSLTHRDIFYPLEKLKVEGCRIKQEAGDIVIVHPSAIHSIKNHGMNIAESRNYLPFEFKEQIASYKTCKDSEGLGGKPLQKQMDILIKDLPVDNFIHQSDKHKQYKIKVLEHFQREGNLKRYEEAVRHIKQYHDVPEWFKDHVPLNKKNVCTVCEYKTKRYPDLTKHMRRKHKGVKIPPNTNKEVCNDCSKITRDVSRHSCPKTKVDFYT